MWRQPPSLGVSSPCQATMTELQEVQITEEKPLLPGQTPEMAKVIRDPLTPRPQFQTSKHPSHLLPFQIHNLILIHTPFSTTPHVSLPIYHNWESRPLSCHYTNLNPLHVFLSSLSVFGLFTYLSLSVSVSPSVYPLYLAVCFCVDLSVCVSLQEAELAARILLDRGQVTAGGSSRVGGGALLSPRKERPSYLALLSATFLSNPVLAHPPHLSPSFPYSVSEFPDAFQSFLILLHPQNHLHCYIYLN